MDSIIGADKMRVEKQKVILEIHSEIIDDSNKVESSTDTYTANHFYKDGMWVWLFKEAQENVGTINHQITLREDTLTIKRSGAVKMQQQFIVGKKTECLYRHPYGQFLMEIKTKSLNKQDFSQNEIRVQVEYDMITNNENRQFKIRIKSMEVPS